MDDDDVMAKMLEAMMISLAQIVTSKPDVMAAYLRIAGSSGTKGKDVTHADGR